MRYPSTKQSYFGADVPTFLRLSPTFVLGELTANSEFDVDTTQRDAWLSEVEILQSALAEHEGAVFLKFIVPRIGSRIDAVVLSNGVIVVLEFKVGERDFLNVDLNQVWDYALDLKNFHKGSHGALIFPILVATEASHSDATLQRPHDDGVFPPLRCNIRGLPDTLRLALGKANGHHISAEEWSMAPYQPTPTIIEAAQALFSQHSVVAIARHDAGAHNLAVTSDRVEQLIERARELDQKMIVFVTGVPGAGKTLVGLNVATKKRDYTATHATFLSGNSPLVAVLSEALARDEMRRLRHGGQKPRKGDVEQRVKAFIQNVHHFRDAALRNEAPPSDRVVIFDEAQRAWNLEKTADFMRQKKNRPDFSQSEPEFLISYMDRHNDWAVVVCLVGGGQEINRGESGLSAWLDAVRDHFPAWHVLLSPNLTDSEYAAGRSLDALAERPNVETDESLHLSVSLRSFRAEKVSDFVKAVLDCDAGTATEILTRLSSKYPIVLTRDLRLAKRWILDQARGSERYGLVASSEAQRLKPHAIDVRFKVDPVQWFLNGPEDTRSSFYLEDAATQFQCQGLELDWVCVTWDADLRFAKGDWTHHAFRGRAWTNIKKDDRRQFLTNAYRVLLTRARQGMVIFVPEGEPSDRTRAPSFYDSTFEYLSGLGVLS